MASSTSFATSPFFSAQPKSSSITYEDNRVVRLVEPSGKVGTQYPNELGSGWFGTIENLGWASRDRLTTFNEQFSATIRALHRRAEPLNLYPGS